MVGVQADAETQGHQVRLMRGSGLGDVSHRHLHPQRNATTAIQGEHAFGHQQPQRMLLLRKRGEQHHRCLARHGEGLLVNGLAQHGGHALGVEMLFKHFQFAAHPGFTDQGAQGRDQLGDELGSAQIHHRLVQAFAQTGQVVGQQTVHERVQIDLRCVDGPAGFGQSQLGHADALKFFQRHGHHLAGSKALVEQAFDGAQFFHL